ncbi:hypothetical protein [Lentzea sp. E54]|uniref:hypothetical protein n=1 Tax=Lentzea xerophila TaxID=3435883 RepID=UPI003DA2E431
MSTSTDHLSLFMAQIQASRDEAYSWFLVLCATAQRAAEASPDLSWGTFTEALSLQVQDGVLSPDQAARFRDFAVGYQVDRELPADLATTSPDQLLAAYDTFTSPTGQSYNEDDFIRLVQRVGADWDRDGASWVGFRTYLLNEANDLGLSVPVRHLLEILDQASDQTREEIFLAYGVQFPPRRVHRPAVPAPKTTQAASPRRGGLDVLATWQAEVLEVQYELSEFIAAIPVPGLEFFVHGVIGLTGGHDQHKRVSAELARDMTRWGTLFAGARMNGEHAVRRVWDEAERITRKYFEENSKPARILRGR